MIVVGNETRGKVKSIGFRHTEIQSPDGELVVVANKACIHLHLKLGIVSKYCHYMSFDKRNNMYILL